jgi:hypothetical protein
VEGPGKLDHRHRQQAKYIPISQGITDRLPPGDIQPRFGTRDMKLAGKGKPDQRPEAKPD